MRCLSVREAEVIEQALEIITVVITDVPEHGLEVTGARRLVDGVDDLLEAVGDDLVEGALFLGEVHHFVGPLVIVFSVLLLDEISASLDEETERELYTRLFAAYPAKTMIFITHRSAVTALCDETLKV